MSNTPRTRQRPHAVQHPAMASSASSSGMGHSVPTLTAGVLVLFNVGKPWSEDTPGGSFLTWWRKVFPDEDLPEGLSSDEVFPLQQQEEWVTALSHRAGIDGLLKPLDAMTPAARAQQQHCQAPGSGVVKLVLRLVQCRQPGAQLRFTKDGRRICGVLRLAAGMCITPVSRDNIRRNRPDTLFPTISRPC